MTKSNNCLCSQFNRYSADYSIFHFCIADNEHDWRDGSEQHSFIEHCLASVDKNRSRALADFFGFALETLQGCCLSTLVITQYFFQTKTHHNLKCTGQSHLVNIHTCIWHLYQVSFPYPFHCQEYPFIKR